MKSLRQPFTLTAFTLVAWAITASAPAQTPVTTESLLREMTDLAGLAEFPDPPFICKQFSSYDPKSKTPDDQPGWFANDDCGQFMRIEEREGRKEHVMADMDGPGAIVRIWSANPAGTLRIYLDGAEKPAIECLLSEWLGGTYPGIPKPIAGEYSKGWNSYFPIAYAKHCKVTSDQPGFYYHVNYRLYPAGTPIASFEPIDVRAHSRPIYETAADLAFPGRFASPLETGVTMNIGFDKTLKPGETVGLGTCADMSAVVTKWDVKISADDIARAMREVVFVFQFDGEETVRAPLGDLLGGCIGATSYESVPVSVKRDLSSTTRWCMPFEKNFSAHCEYHGSQPVQISGKFIANRYKWTERSMHFHAKWRADWQVGTRPMIDWNYLTATGKGQFVGVAFNIANPVKAWWGEGDEKIYVDGEKFPSWFGTGTEDYYGYAWCWPVPFQHAYHAQPRCDGPGNYGITCINRFHILDRIPFNKDFRFDMELWHWNEAAKVDMSVTAYWYARPGGSDKFPPIRAEDLRVPNLPPYQPPKVAGAIEGESLKVLEKTGAIEVQGLEGTSDEKHLWWKGGQKVGDSLVVALPVEKSGKSHLIVRGVKARDYAIVQFSLNGRKIGEPVDFYNPNVTPGDEVDLGEVDLKAGENRLSISVVGANEKAVKTYMVGLDYVLVR